MAKSIELGGVPNLSSFNYKLFLDVSTKLRHSSTLDSTKGDTSLSLDPQSLGILNNLVVKNEVLKSKVEGYPDLDFGLGVADSSGSTIHPLATTSVNSSLSPTRLEKPAMYSESLQLLMTKPIKLESCSTFESYMLRAAWELAGQLAAERIIPIGRGDRRQLRNVTKLALASETKPQHYKARKRDTHGPNLDKLCDSSLASKGYAPSRNSEPIVHCPQNIPSPPALRTSGDDPPRQNHDGVTSHTNGPPPGSPGRWIGPDIEMSDISLRDGESEPPPPNDEPGDNTTQAISSQKVTSMFSLPLCGIAVFLAPVNIVSGMTASHGDNWKLAFVSFFISWLIVGTAWLFLDLRGLQRSRFTKRCLWHLGGCAASLYFFMSILHITSDNLPQWLPTIIDCGIGASLGFQAIPSSARKRVGEAITSVIGGIFGGTQVIVRRDEERLLSENEPSSTRRRRADIEEGLVS